MLEGLDADVVGLQEVYAFQRRWLERRLPRHEGYGVGRGRFGGGEQCLLLVDEQKATVTDWQTRWFGPRPDQPGQRLPGARFPRTATTCRVQPVGHTGPIVVTNVHLDATSEARRLSSVEQLLTWLDMREPQIVMGDLNAVPGDEPVERLEASGLRSVLPPAAGGTDHSFTGRTDGPRLDHVFVSEHLDVRSATIHHVPDLKPLPSDHWPVVADLELRRR